MGSRGTMRWDGNGIKGITGSSGWDGNGINRIDVMG